jgi:hypothetical protein
LQRCKTRKAWRGGKAAMFEEEEFKHQVAQALQVPDSSMAAKKLYIAVADMLLSPSTVLPIDSTTLHKKVRPSTLAVGPPPRWPGCQAERRACLARPRCRGGHQPAAWARRP